jgi:hypothetical protein
MNYLVDVALQDSTVQNAAERQYFAEFEGHWQLTLDPNFLSHEEGRLTRSSLGWTRKSRSPFLILKSKCSVMRQDGFMVKSCYGSGRALE